MNKRKLRQILRESIRKVLLTEDVDLAVEECIMNIEMNGIDTSDSYAVQMECERWAMAHGADVQEVIARVKEYIRYGGF